MSDPNYRRCWECGAINLHADSITPEVCCKRCGSQDTRRMKSEPPLWNITPSSRNGRGVYVSDKIGKCPECGDGLIATCYEHEADSGRPVATGIELTCLCFLRDDADQKRDSHQYTQSKWQPVRDAVAKWCDARVDYPGR